MDAIILFLHTFRLPAFFVMAGFFAALLVEKRGWQKMLEKRMMRLGLPLILGMLTIYPVLRMTSVYFYYQGHDGKGWAGLMGWLGRGRLSEDLEPGHFWFLETLLLATLLALAGRRWLAKLKGAWFVRLMASRWGILPIALTSTGTLMVSEFGLLDTPHGFSPHWHVVAAYTVFYLFGWGLFEHRNALWLMKKYGVKEMFAALALMIPYLAAIDAQLAHRGTRVWSAYCATAVITALMAWLMIYGLTGFFLRRCSDADERVRYFSEAAYWIYVAHPLVLVALQIPMMSLPWNEWVKFTAGMAAAFPILMWTYDRLVRGTWVGLALNGRRLPRWNESMVAPAASPILEPQSESPGS